MHLNKYNTFNIKENTPNQFFNQLNKEFNFNFDPCPENPTFDGLFIPWKGNIYINPPYGKEIRKWLESRLKFGGHKESAPFASVLVVFKRGDLT